MSFRSACFYRLCRHVLIGPALYLHGRPKIEGREHIPREGPVILAANHLAVVDSFYLTLAARRQVAFLAKREYFRGWKRWFFTAAGQIPVDRRGGSTAAPALETAVRLIERGRAWGIHPEGTRSPDGRLYRGRTGAVRVAIATGAPLVPVAITGTAPGTPWRRRRVTIEILPPLSLPRGIGVRPATDLLMHTIGARTGQSYVDAYAGPGRPPAESVEAA
ncbi:lysophospholipid acyltransferase family protein [Nocardia asteroides]|uniref:lysophospholipid acyltransferase family protein n=1 Tax=Nocardia asteroides TaxID=1824 RepID=UPI001E636AD8|nr:lysophospholipid acyltransferase family protein [Nocardia asteroides]UGT61225.1 1-acyl-sn-glycerol-3-phosphate acyltransferase [Nocardia asteroides]